jgi:carboxyl-terminal processing protease
MDDVVDYSKKLKEEMKKQKKVYIIICLIVTFLAFSIGFYASYAFNNSNNNGYKGKLDTIYSILKDEWYYGIDDENIEKTLIDRAIYGMVDENKDPFTRYLTSLGSLATSYEGLGITISEYKEYFVVSDVVSKINIDAGFKKGDIIKSIDNVSLENKSIDDIKTLIENKDSVDILVERGGVDVSLIGYITTYSPVTVFKDFSSEEMALVRISEFSADTADYLEMYLKEAKQEGYNKLILDLRDNPGGYINSVVRCADLFMGKGKIVLTTKDKHGNSYSYKTTKEGKYDFSKIVVLINNGSASGAEALSAALNENMGDIVELMGVTTYGKGSAQKTIHFTDGTYFHYTYALWFTPNDKSINKTGVEPESVYTGSGIHLLNFSKVNLKKKDYGVNVYNLQVVMNSLGYYDGEFTSYFDEQLEMSVKKYQADNSLEQTGELDNLTIRYILAKYYDDQIVDYRNEVNKVINDYGA